MMRIRISALRRKNIRLEMGALCCWSDWFTLIRLEGPHSCVEISSVKRFHIAIPSMISIWCCRTLRLFIETDHKSSSRLVVVAVRLDYLVCCLFTYRGRRPGAACVFQCL
ncbi:unnamed protein product [Amoebophrya sp. A25]|nr:unnamed protein product [Amoebophrya sp. A25]|eukprot:GSA25T00009867001.1